MNLHLNLHLIGKQGQKHKFSNVTAIFSGANIKCQERYSCLSNNSLIPLRIIRPAQILVHNAIRSTCLFATRTHPPLLSPFSCTNWPNSTCKSWPQTGYVTAWTVR